MLNKIVIMGRLTRDPELRYTQSQTPVASFTLAVDRDFADQSGERQTDFIDCVAWRSTAEFASKYFSKGKMAVAAGRLQLRDWTDRDGNKRRSAEVIVDNLYFGESKRDNDGGQRGGYLPQGGYQEPPQGGYQQRQQGGYGGTYGAPQGGYNAQGGRSGAQAPGGYPPSDYGGGPGGFSEMSDYDDGELPF